MSNIKIGKSGEKNVFLSSDCPVKKVTVYSDRAEVCRQIDAVVVQGVNEVFLKQLPVSIDQDSIRVEGTGQATIAEVSFQTKYETTDQADQSSKEKELEGQLKDLTREKEQLTAKQNVLSKQLRLLDNFGETVSRAPREKAPALDSSSLNGIRDFLKLFKAEGEKVECSRLELSEQISILNEKINVTKDNLTNLRGNKTEQKESRVCTIVLESEGEGKVTLLVSYVVTQALWTPSYDLRMFTSEGVLKIHYYGQITQCTGEDWNNAKLFLSTATPSIGGTVPELSVAVLSLKPVYKRRSSSSSWGLFRSRTQKCAMECDMGPSDDESWPPGSSGDVAPMDYAVTEVKDTTTSASYEIARQSTVPSDTMPHKVSIAIIDLKPALEYITVPKVSPRAFLRAKVTNSSAYTLLPGASSIFLDNSFVAKAEIKSVSPWEEFVCSLGVDPSVRVNYKPLNKFKGSTGFIGKNICTKYEQPIEIKNTHDYPIKIEVKEQLPRSSDEKIKVTLIDPVVDMKHPEKMKNPHLNKQNHIIWNLEVNKQDTREITLKYTVEHPQKGSIETSQVYEDYE